MSYKIAVGSLDGTNVDLKFGEAESFRIYEVNGTESTFLEFRSITGKESPAGASSAECGLAAGCGSGSCSGNGGGCGGPSEVVDRVSKISDCRCLVCKKVGFQAQKQLERKAIAVFDVDCEVAEALSKITVYYDKLDHNQSLRSRKN